MIQWLYFPRSNRATPLAHSVVAALERVSGQIDSADHDLPSNEVLLRVADPLRTLGFRVEAGKRVEQKINVPVLFGLNGGVEKAFDADAHHEASGFVLEVEAGRGVVNNQFLKDLFQACMMHDVMYLGIAVRNIYKGRKTLRLSVVF